MSAITCPWCGTHYAAFQSNCKNCGGPLPPMEREAEQERAVAPRAPVPPPAPRTFANSYVWRLVLADGWALAGGIFSLIGSIFACVGLPLILGIITAPVGVIFAGMGGLFVVGGGWVFARRYQTAQITLDVLRHGQAAEGQIISAAQNYNVRVNGQHPWIIRYQFAVNGRALEGSVTTLNAVGTQFQPGQFACVLYLPNAPEHNALYPHP